MPFPNPQTQFKTGPKQVEIARKAGQSKSIKKSIAARIRQLKKHGIKNDSIEKIIQLMENPNIDAFDRLAYIQKMKAIAGNNIKDMDIIIKNWNAWSKQYHGDKSTQLNQQININTQPISINIVYEQNANMETNNKTKNSI